MILIHYQLIFSYDLSKFEAVGKLFEGNTISMNNRGTWAVAIFSFALTLAVYQVASKAVATFFPTTSWLVILIEFFASIGVFTVVFELASSVHSYLGTKFIYKYYDITKDWHQVMIVDGPSPIEQRIRYGKCNINKVGNSFFIAAESYRPGDNTLSSNWQSEATLVSNKKITVMYLSEGTRRINNIRRGTIVFNLHGAPPNTIRGIFNDSAPADTSGEITLFSDECEYRAFLKSLVDNESTLSEAQA